MSLPSSPVNGQTAILNGITYVYNSTNNAWKRQSLTDLSIIGNVTTGNITANTGINFVDGSRITSGFVYDLDYIYPDGTKNTFYLTYNQNAVTVSNPWNLLVSINNFLQPAFAENYDKVWLSHTMSAATGYTISSGNLKFSDCPPAGTTIFVRTQLGSPNPTTKIYPFNPLDIAMGI